MTILKQTPLYNLHLRMAARLTEFAGYAMPLQYRHGIIHEHLHCRRQAGFFDISHMGQCRIAGRTAAGELDKLTLGGVADLEPGEQKYTVLTNGEGGVIDDIIVTRLESGLSLVVNAGCKDKDFAYLRQRLPSACEIQECTDLALLALQGPASGAIMQKLSPQAAGLSFMHACSTEIGGLSCNVSRSGYTGEDGFEISLHRDYAEPLAELLLAQDGVEPIGLGARDTLRLEAGLCLYGHELDEAITPIEAGLKWLLKKGHDDFPGAETIRTQFRQGTWRIRVGLAVQGRMPVREGCEIFDPENRLAGRVTSGGFSPSLNRPVAMALVDSRYAAVGTSLFAPVRGKPVPVDVCPLPFVSHRYRR